MHMNRDLIQAYIRKLTIGVGSAASDPFADITLFDNDVHSMKMAAERAGDLEWLRLSLDALIANPRGRIGQFVEQGYPYSDDEMVTLLTYAYQKIWPDHKISDPGEEAALEFVEMSDETWQAIKNPPESDDLF
ncbi:hypothetical protein [Phaeobacter sp. HF9A]|uniref:hypothetical protein n=1 Tax=Phaeobacter sp. HF9A TaxID=2721561 RepID=UPI001431E4F1|nr:hypothetical protein [Phaeobacter sp. HF9A]NIZ14726.1 hypothetical protein [Phaeobacter sp. HF9A]